MSQVFAGRYPRGMLVTPGHRLMGKMRATEHPLIRQKLVAGLPSEAYLTEWQPGIFDQGTDEDGGTGSCTAHSFLGATSTALKAAGTPLPFLVGSMDLLYKVTRAVARAAATPVGQPEPDLQDEGAQLEDVVTAASQFGIAPMGPQVEGRNSDCDAATVNDEPDLARIEKAGVTLVSGEYVASPDSDVVAASIAARIPVWVGFFVDSAFEDLAPGQVAKAPNQNDPTGGGHAVYLSGFKGAKGSRVFELTNSWGYWCDKGKCLVSEAWLRATWSLYPMAVKVNA